MRIATWREDRLVDLKETEEAVEWADEMIRAQDGRVLAIQDEALDLAVRGVREAESAGTLAPDPRPDAEIRESIREMWEADMEREREEEERGD